MKYTVDEIDYSKPGVVENMRTSVLAAAMCRLAEYEKTGYEPWQISFCWISVKDKLPDVFEDVIICGKYKTQKNILSVSCGYYCDNSWHIDGEEDCYNYFDVYYWAPLPAPPKTEVIKNGV